MKQRAVEKYYSIPEAAFLLGFSPAWVRKTFCAGGCEGVVKIDSDYRIAASTINAFLDQHTVMTVTEAMDAAGVFARSGTEVKRKVRGGSQ